MIPRNSRVQRAGEQSPRRNARPEATPAVLATLTPDEVAQLKARQLAVNDARQVVAEAELELQHYQMTLRKRHQWPATTNVKIDVETGHVTEWDGRPNG